MATPPENELNSEATLRLREVVERMERRFGIQHRPDLRLVVASDVRDVDEDLAVVRAAVNRPLSELEELAVRMSAKAGRHWKPGSPRLPRASARARLVLVPDEEPPC